MRSDDRWKEISALYAAALQRPESERDAFLAEACATDLELREELASLLACHTDAQKMLTVPAAEMLAAGLVTAPSVPVGRTLGAYRIDAPLGAGGMGEVYRATDMRLQRQVAIKILPPHLREDAVLRSLLEREAQVVASLLTPTSASSTISGIRTASTSSSWSCWLAKRSPRASRAGRCR